MKDRKIYNRPRIDKLLASGAAFPLSVITAGPGCGKTTAADDYLKKTGTPYIWITLTDGDGNVFWDKLCRAMEAQNSKTASALRVIGLPEDAWSISRIVNLIHENCSSPFTVCIDDYQMFPEDSPVHRLIETIAFEDIPDFHIMILSRSGLNIRTATLESKKMACCIEAETLNFNLEEATGYLNMRGLQLNPGAISEMMETSCGWISAIFLMSEGIRSGKETRFDNNINALFEENLLRPLSETDRNILYRLSAFEYFPIELAVYALDTKRARLLIDSLMRENAFITCDQNGLYNFHPLLRNALKTRCPNDEIQKNVYRRAGQWYLSQSDFHTPYTVDLFRKADCVEEFLSINNKPGARRLNYYDMDALCRMAMELPDDTCLNYPFPYLQICFYLLLSGEKRYIRFSRRLLDRMQQYFETHEAPYRNNILGELIVISRVTGFGHIDGDEEPLEKATELLGGRPSETLDPSDPFTFGLPMLLHSEYMSPGTLDETIQRCQNNPYELVTDGFGHGSERLIRAEAALMRCQMQEARVLAEQSVHEAAEKRQSFVMASAYSVLMRRALYLGDTDGASQQLDNIRELLSTMAGTLDEKRVTVTMLREVTELAECFFNTTLYRKNEIPPDFLDGSHQSAMAAGLGIPQVYSARAMYATGNPVGASVICGELQKLPQVCQSARLYGLIIAALSQESSYGSENGLQLLQTALVEAQSDNILLPFAEYPALLPLLSKIKKGGPINSAFLERVRRQCKAYETVAPKNPGSQPPRLSNRECEVLRLTAAGKSRAEVAACLHVQENTVKTQLSSAYKKLGAKGKIEAIRLARSWNLL